MNEKYFGRLEHQPPSNKREIKKVLNENRAEALDLFERVFANKIVQDIEFILKQGWAEQISRRDFFHGHASFRRKIPLTGDRKKDLERVISPEHIDFNYHTRECIEPRGSNWNIYAPSDGLPQVMPEDKTVKGIIYFHINFDLADNGKYPIVYEGENRRIELTFSMMKD